MITITAKPSKFNPSENPIIWQWLTDNPNCYSFKAKLIDVQTSGLIAQQAFQMHPVLIRGTFWNLSGLLKNIVFPEINPDGFALIAPLRKPVRGYRLELTERLKVDGAWTDGETYTSEDHFVWNAELSRLAASNYNQLKHVVNSSSLSTFLTKQPKHKKVNDLSFEQLTFLHDGSQPFLFVRIRLYQGHIIKQTIQEQITNLHLNSMFRLNVSPKSLVDSKSVDFEGITHYTVSVLDQAGLKTVEKTYVYQETECWKVHLNLIWLNSLGGWDSYQFNTPSDTLNISKFTMKTNTHGLDENGVYSDQLNGIYRPSEAILSSKTTTSTKVYSNELTDPEAVWLSELFQSKNVYVENTDGSLIPVTITQNSYTIQKLKQMRGQLNQISLDFTLAQGVVISPSTSESSTGKNSLEFIDDQMNSITTDTNGFGISPDEEDNGDNQYNPDEYSDGYA